jgi:hypothetical protein
MIQFRKSKRSIKKTTEAENKMVFTTNFKQDIYNILLLRMYDNGSDTQGQIFYRDINGSVRYVFSMEPPSGKRLLPGQHELRLCRIGEAFEKSCKHKDGYVRASSYKFGIITIIGENTPIFGVEQNKWPKCIVPGNIINNNCSETGKIDDIFKAYSFFISSVYRAFIENRIVRLAIMSCDKGIKRQFDIDERYGQGMKLFSILG